MGRITDWSSEWSLQNKSEWTRSRWIVWENGGTHGHREKFIKVWGKKWKARASSGPERSWILLEYLLDVPTTMSVSLHHPNPSHVFNGKNETRIQVRAHFIHEDVHLPGMVSMTTTSKSKGKGDSVPQKLMRSPTPICHHNLATLTRFSHQWHLNYSFI